MKVIGFELRSFILFTVTLPVIPVLYRNLHSREEVEPIEEIPRNKYGE